MTPEPISKYKLVNASVYDGEEFRRSEVNVTQHGQRYCVDTQTPDHEMVELDIGGRFVTPAPVDLHFHGAGGFAVPPLGATAQINHALASSCAARETVIDGVTFRPSYDWLATLPIPNGAIEDPVSELSKAAHEITKNDDFELSSQCIGLRLEGLFLNPEKAGVWPAERFRDLDVGLLDELEAAAREAGSRLRIVDIAPEMAAPQQLTKFIEKARELGIVVALAHTNATYEQALLAIEAGATLATHTWNAMRSLHHREPGVVGACLANERVSLELICDGLHLHKAIMKLTLSAAANRWISISDASPFALCPPGVYSWAGHEVIHDGKSLMTREGTLAGSASLAWGSLEVLAEIGVDASQTARAMGARPRTILDPDRSNELCHGDAIWVI